MYRFSLLSYFIFSAVFVFCQDRQVHIPALSPFQKTELKVGVVDVVVEYSRPSMKGREIFGALTPYGELPNKYLIKSEILAALGEMELAIEAAERSLRLAELVDDEYYRNRNLENLRLWQD